MRAYHVMWKVRKALAISLVVLMSTSVLLASCSQSNDLGVVSDAVPITSKHKIVVKREDAANSSIVKEKWSNADKQELWKCLSALTPCDQVDTIYYSGALVLYATDNTETIKMTFRETFATMEYQNETQWLAWDKADFERFQNCVNQ